VANISLQKLLGEQQKGRWVGSYHNDLSVLLGNLNVHTHNIIIHPQVDIIKYNNNGYYYRKATKNYAYILYMLFDFTRK
jgi:hypothetical protein